MGSEQDSGMITGLLGNIVDDTMTFVDDLLNRAKNLEADTRGAVSNMVDVSSEEERNEEMAKLEAGLHDLQNRMEQLSTMKSKANSK